jgi:hypothetical protein
MAFGTPEIGVFLFARVALFVRYMRQANTAHDTSEQTVVDREVAPKSPTWMFLRVLYHSLGRFHLFPKTLSFVAETDRRMTLRHQVLLSSTRCHARTAAGALLNGAGDDPFTCISQRLSTKRIRHHLQFRLMP